MGKRIKATVGIDDDGSRLDVFLAGFPGLVSRSAAQRLIDSGKVLVGDKQRSKKFLVHLGDQVFYDQPSEEVATVEPESISLNIVFEDGDLIVIDKPAGLVVHPATGNYTGTLVNALLGHTKLAAIGSPLRPGIVHRLDKDTSGLIVVTKNNEAYMSLVDQIKKRSVGREYLALVAGGFSDKYGRVEAPIRRSPNNRKMMSVGASGAKQTITEFTVVGSTGEFSLLEVKLQTGRTHQIRVHCKYINHAVVGDQVYGSPTINKKVGIDRQWLHAFRLRILHPTTGKEMVFMSRPPAELTQVLNGLGLEWG